MGGKETTGKHIRRHLPDARRAPPGVATGAPSGRRGEGKGDGGRGGDRGINIGARVRREGERSRGRDIGRSGVGGKGAEQVVKGGGDSSTSVPRRSATRGGVLEGGGTDPKSRRGLTRHRPRGGDLEGGGSDSQLPLHRRHKPPRLPPRIPGGSRYGERHPRAQADSAGFSLEGGGPPCNLPGPAQGLRCLGQVQVTGYPGGVAWGLGPYASSVYIG